MEFDGKTYLDGRTSDPAVLGWMQGTPPPPDKRITFAEDRYFAFPQIRFVLSGPDRSTLELPSTGEDRLARIAQVLGKDFRDNAIEIDAEREGVRLAGFAGVPTFNRGNSLHQFAFVNGRPVQDKLIWSALRGAYAETVPSGRYPVAVLEIAIDPELVDVNVHPAKSDVRFRDPGLVRGLIIGAIRQALTREGDRAATTGAAGLMRNPYTGALIMATNMTVAMSAGSALTEHHGGSHISKRDRREDHAERGGVIRHRPGRRSRVESR